MPEHERKVDDVERELDDLQEQSERVGEEIESTRGERKKRDDRVPGAAGDPEQAEGDIPDEADEPPGD